MCIAEEWHETLTYASKIGKRNKRVTTYGLVLEILVHAKSSSCLLSDIYDQASLTLLGERSKPVANTYQVSYAGISHWKFFLHMKLPSLFCFGLSLSLSLAILG